MTLENFLSLSAYIGALLLLAPLLGKYMARALFGERVFLSPILQPVEQLIYRCCVIDPKSEMHWKKYAIATAWFSLFGFLAVFLLLIFQHRLPLNPENFQGVSYPLAFNIAISFMTNTNWQAYSGESMLGYLVQTAGLSVQNFLSAAVGLAILLAFIRGLISKNAAKIGNFWVDIVRSCLYVLLPLSLIFSLFLISQGVVQNFSSYLKVKTLEGLEQILPMGPAASQIAIKQLGSNGGGFFGVNSAHPFENPTPFSNFLQVLAILLVPAALVYMFGVVTKQRKHAFMIFVVMLSIFLSALLVSLWSEHLPNPALLTARSLEGKEQRFGITDSILWSSATTAASNGAINSMHDSLSPIAGGIALLQILLGEIIFGGVGSGLYCMLLFVLLTVFLAGLMVGRTPEYLGKKLDSFDIQMVVLAIILPSAVVLIGAGISITLPLAHESILNQGPHGLSEILYAWASAANNNGSAFAGLNVNTNFYNLGLGIAMLIGRFGVIVPVLALAGNLANKKPLPKSSATFATDTPIFATLLVFIIVTIGALSFFPALVLGPLTEHLLMMTGHSF